MEERINAHGRKELLVILSKFPVVLAAVLTHLRYALVSVALWVPPPDLIWSLVDLRNLAEQSLSEDSMELIEHKAWKAIEPVVRIGTIPSFAEVGLYSPEALIERKKVERNCNPESAE